jgi:branched-chain amino acid aminotransferase
MGTFLRMTITPPQSFSSPSPEDADFGRGAAYVEGEIVPVLDARIPLLDTGFTRSDATYDVVAVWNGKFFRLDDHLERFERSCRELRLTPPLGRGEIRDLLSELVRRASLRESYVEVICTRGVDTAGVRDPRQFENRFYAFAVPYVWLLAREDHETGMHAVITRTVRRISSQAVDPTVKNFHWGDLTRGLYEAFDRDARYPILLDAEGNVTEGAGYNVFALVDGVLLTPEAGTLEGITRRTVLELADEQGVPAEAIPIPERIFRQATELFATSTAGGVMPITRLDGEPVGHGAIGRVTRRLLDRYWEIHDDPRYATPVEYGTPAAP